MQPACRDYFEGEVIYIHPEARFYRAKFKVGDSYIIESFYLKPRRGKSANAPEDNKAL